MRSSRVLLGALALLACTGTDGDILRTRHAPSSGDGGEGGAADTEPTPRPLRSWQIQLSGELDTSIDVAIYVVDLDTRPSVIRELHDHGRTVICYFSAGTMEPFREDAGEFPESSLGGRLPDYPDERFIDVRDAAVRAIMQARAARAKNAGCDGIHPSGLAAFLADTELDFARADQVAYDRWLASVARDLGLTIGLVDGDASLSDELSPDFDWTVVWSCLRTECAAAAPFIASGKEAFLVEYGDETRASEVCPHAKSLGLSAIIKRNSALDAFRVGCP